MWDIEDLSNYVISGSIEDYKVLELTYWQKMEITYILMSLYVELNTGDSHDEDSIAILSYVEKINNATQVEHDLFIVALSNDTITDVYEYLMLYSEKHPLYMVRGKWYYSEWY